MFSSNTIENFLIWAAILYFIPSLIALLRGHNFASVFALNLFLGWTFVGWVIALAWSLAARPTAKVVLSQPQAIAEKDRINDTPRSVSTVAEEKTCPRCAEQVKAAAQVCRFCGHEFKPAQFTESSGGEQKATLAKVAERDTEFDTQYYKLAGYLGGAAAILLIAVVVIAFAVSRQSGSRIESDSVSNPGSSDTASSAPDTPPTADYKALLKAVQEAQTAYPQADNDLKRSEIRKARDDAVAAAIHNGNFVHWRGTLMSMWTDSKGNASIKVGLMDCRCGLVTGDGYEIEIGSDLFNGLKQMKIGDHVLVTGTMGAESSFTEAGSIDDPEWYADFTDVEPDTTPYPAEAAPIAAPTANAPSSAPSAPVEPSQSNAVPTAPQATAPPAAVQNGQQGDNTANNGVDSENPANGPDQGSVPAQTTTAQSQPRGSWYYCDPLRAYYPYVQRCPTPWRAVSPNSITSAQSDSQQSRATGPPAILNPNSSTTRGGSQ